MLSLSYKRGVALEFVYIDAKGLKKIKMGGVSLRLETPRSCSCLWVQGREEVSIESLRLRGGT